MSPPRALLAWLSKRALSVSVVLLVVAAAALIAWLARGRSPVTMSVSASTHAPPTNVWSGGEKPASTLPIATSASGALSPARDPVLVEVCGLGWADVPAEASWPDPRLFAQVPGVEASLTAIVSRMQASGDSFARAVITVLEMSNGGARSAALLEQLAHEAVTTEDPRVYAMAFQGCSKAANHGSCALLSLAQWARLDPANAAPWLFVLGEATLRRDRAGIDEALHRIGASPRFDDRPHSMAAEVVAHAGPADADLVAAHVLVVNAVGVSAAFWAPLPAVRQACSASALADANRRQACDAVAATMGERTDSLLIASIGASLGRDLGWTVDRLTAIGALSAALSDASSADKGMSPRFGMSFSCDGMRSAFARFERLAEVGEPQLAREWMASSGKPREFYMRAARDRELRLSRQAEEVSRPLTKSGLQAASAARPER